MPELVPDVYDPWWNVKQEDGYPEDLEWDLITDIYNEEND